MTLGIRKASIPTLMLALTSVAVRSLAQAPAQL